HLPRILAVEVALREGSGGTRSGVRKAAKPSQAKPKGANRAGTKKSTARATSDLRIKVTGKKAGTAKAGRKKMTARKTAR
ncbi:MAG: hypothetical protein KC729_12660, partial [Candidatus Eisenbacteria bacterium]|nr:hypothetical protein [Candidatus Eisenbacteria bacterium]